MPGLDHVIEVAAAIAAPALGYGLAATLLVLVLAGFYAWFIPRRSGRRGARSRPTRRDPAAFMEGAP